MLGDSLRFCNLCGMVHPVKTIHLQLDDNGRATVSFGVLELMRRAGLKRFGFVLRGFHSRPSLRYVWIIRGRGPRLITPTGRRICGERRVCLDEHSKN